MSLASILWRRLDPPGHDAARLISRDPDWQLTGTAIFAHHGGACRLDYDVFCDAAWRTRRASVVGWIGDREVDVAISVDAHGIWRLDGRACDRVKGCVDIDLSFTPSTNTVPIRRLSLAVGARAEVRAAWLKFPELDLEPLAQTYWRIDESRYRYESGGGTFSRDLHVDANGLVVEYPELWSIET